MTATPSGGRSSRPAPLMPFGLEQTAGPNEPWSFGPEAYEHITAALFLRERLRPYVMTLMRAAHAEGIPCATARTFPSPARVSG